MPKTIEVLSSYLPRVIAASMLDLSNPSPYEWSEYVDAVVVFADIAGFTPIAEALGAYGPQGTEELTRILNSTFTPMIHQVHQWGGTIGKFAGDALTVLFTGDHAGQRAIACTLALRDVVTSEGAFQTRAGRFTIQMKFGLAAGRILQAIVGGSHRAEFVFAGRAADDAANAEHHAAAGQIVLHPSFLSRLSSDEVTVVPIDEGYARLQDAQISISTAPLPPFLTPSDVERASQILRPFLPFPIYQRLLTSGTFFVNEHRHITVLFVGFDGIEAVTTGPVGDVEIEELRELCGEHDTIIWGGVPGAMFSPPWTAEQIRENTVRLLDEMAPDNRLIVGSADQVPPDGDVDFCRVVADTIAEWAAS